MLETLLKNAPSNIKNRFTYKLYHAGDHIFESGNTNEHLIIIQEGNIEICKESIDGSMMSLNQYHGATILGELEIFNESLTTQTVLALSDCKAIIMHKTTLFEWMKDDFDLTTYIIRHVTNELKVRERQSMILAKLSVYDRMLMAIYQYHRLETLSSVNKNQLSKDIDTPIRSVNRAIARAIEEGFIDYKKSITIKDEHMLMTHIKNLNRRLE